MDWYKQIYNQIEDEIKNLDVFTNVENLFLQFNQITQIKNLDCLINLEYLALNGNQITKIQNLKHLLNLCFLNLAENQIEYLDEKELPKYLEFLNVSQNPLIQKDKDYEKKVISHLEYIEELNGIEITPHIKLQILGIYPKNVNGYEKTIHKDEDDEYQPTEEELKKLQQYEFDTRDGVVSLQDKTEKIVTKYKIDTQKELENIQNELQDYMILKQEIKQQVELNSKHAKNLGQSQFFE